MPSEAWLARSAMAVWPAWSAWRSGLPGGGPVPVMPVSAGMMTRLVSRVKNRAVDRPSAVSWLVRLCGMRSMIWQSRSLRRS